MGFVTFRRGPVAISTCTYQSSPEGSKISSLFCIIYIYTIYIYIIGFELVVKPPLDIQHVTNENTLT
jgi:hypothetical protein